jgi:Ca-activated chloride channel homolog
MSLPQFARPEFLYLLLLLPVWWLLVWPHGGQGVLFTRSDSARASGSRWGVRATFLLFLPRMLRALAMVAIVVALADPQRTETTQEMGLRGKGMSIVLDLSSSMLAVDMDERRSRISVAKEAAMRFAEGRVHDELSLVGFSGTALTRVPPTTDPNLVVAGVESLEIQLMRDGTDISAAVLTATARLMESERDPRVIVLPTDGAHNGTGVQPLAAARAAAAMDVRVHAISILGVPDTTGPRTLATVALQQRRAQNLRDMETVLEGITDITGGQYFHASSSVQLDSIYSEIDRLEEPVEDVTEHEVRHSLRVWPLLLGMLLLGFDVLLRGSRWSVVP